LSYEELQEKWKSLFDNKKKLENDKLFVPLGLIVIFSSMARVVKVLMDGLRIYSFVMLLIGGIAWYYSRQHEEVVNSYRSEMEALNDLMDNYQ